MAIHETNDEPRGWDTVEVGTSSLRTTDGVYCKSDAMCDSLSDHHDCHLESSDVALGPDPLPVFGKHNLCTTDRREREWYIHI